MGNKAAWILLLTLTSLTAWSQELDEDEACLAPEKKAAKLLEKAKDPKTDLPDRYATWNKLFETDEDCAVCYYEYGLFALDQVEKAGSNPERVRKAWDRVRFGFENAISNCYDVHADAYYWLGIYFYANGKDQEAIDTWKKFLDFSADDYKRYSKNHDQKLAEVQSVIEEKEQEMNFYKKPVPFNPRKLDNVSSPQDEFLPFLSPDNELIFFTRRVSTKRPGQIKELLEELFSLAERKDVNSPFNRGEALGSPFNKLNVFHKVGGATLSIDNKEMIICACRNEDNGYENCDLYMSRFERTGEGGNDFKWTELENLGPNINTNDGWEAQPTLSADGNTLYYACVRHETGNTSDIYYAKRGADGSWGRGMPLPGPINTPGHDKTPFLHQDSQTLYFASECSPSRFGAGGFDIFYSRMDSAGNWGKPKNLGYPINTEDDDVAIIVSTDGHYAYFSTNRERGAQGYDVYYFDLPKEARPKEVLFVKGELKDDKGKPVKEAVVEVSYGDGEEKETFKVNGDDGKYAAVIDLSKNKDATMTVKKENHTYETKFFSAKEAKKTDQTFAKNVDMKVEKIEKGKPYTIKDILYSTASAELNDRSKMVLRKFSEFLKDHPNVKVTIQGHTDNEGDPEKNLILSRDRAKEAKEYLVSLGVPGSRLKSEGFGQTKPKVPNTSDANKALNRRTDFVITDM